MSKPELSIIVVDDLQFSRVVVKTALKKAGYDGVRLADSAAVALKMLEEKPADVVLADWMMPEMDGLTCARKIRTELPEPQCSTPIIALTAKSDKEELAQCLDFGMNECMLKPFNSLLLVKRLLAYVS